MPTRTARVVYSVDGGPDRTQDVAFAVRRLLTGAAANQATPGVTTNPPTPSTQVFLAEAQRIGLLAGSVRRSFDSGMPATWGATAAASDAAAGARSFWSFKPPNVASAAAGTYDAQIRTLVAGAPAGAIITAYHEPENDFTTGTAWRDMMIHLYAVVKAARPDVLFGPAHMSYWWARATPAGPWVRLPGYAGGTAVPTNWIVPDASKDFTAVDTYTGALATNVTRLETDTEFQPWYQTHRTSANPLYLAEYGVQDGVPDGSPPNTTIVADTLNADAAWLALPAQAGIRMVLYWSATGAQGDWRFYRQSELDAWRNGFVNAI